MTDQIRGIDISNNNGSGIDLAKVKAQGASFVFIKASQGSYFTDPDFAGYWQKAQAAGLARGAYAFADPTQCTPQQDAAKFLAVVGKLSDGDLVALDIEIGSGDLSQWCLTWLQIVEDALGTRPLVYSGQWFAQGRLTDPALGAYHLWDAAYQSWLPAPYLPWRSITLWQWTASAQYGFGDVDESLFGGTVEQFKTLGKTPPVATPPVVEQPGPTAPRYTIKTAMSLRVAPVVDAPHTTDVLPVGTALQAISGWTFHWRHVRVAGGRTGWALASNLAAA